MNTPTLFAGVSALALVLGSAAFAQTDLTGTQNVNDVIKDITETVEDDLNRANDASRFAFPEYRPGLSGSASIGYTGKSGNTDSQEFSLGARIRHAQGNFVQNIGVAVDFA